MALGQHRVWAIYIFSFTSHLESNSAFRSDRDVVFDVERKEASFIECSRSQSRVIHADNRAHSIIRSIRSFSQQHRSQIGCNVLNPLIGTRYETTAVLDLEQTKSKIDAQIGQPCTTTHAHSHINKEGIGEFKPGATMIALFCERILKYKGLSVSSSKILIS